MSVVFLYIGLDENSCDFISKKIRKPMVLFQIFTVLLLGIGRLGHFSLRRVNWNRAPKWEVISDKISLHLQVIAIVITLYALSGIFLF